MNEIEHVRKLLESYDTAVLVTQVPDGSTHARPMAIAQVEPSGVRDHTSTASSCW